MRLRYPDINTLEKKEKDWNTLPGIPTKLGVHSGFLLLAISSHQSDGYVCFTNEQKNNVWIEKFNALSTIGTLYFEMFQKITDDEEFAMAYKFFQDQGVLDGSTNQERTQ